MGCITGCLENSLPIVGVISILYFVLKFVNGLKNFYLTYYTPSAVDFNSFGKWALVTGSTDGIGKGIAHQLAKRGLNIVLVSRNPEKLKKVAMEIEQEYHVETKCVTFDFSIPDDLQRGEGASIYDVIDDAIQGLEVGILVNNVGLGATGVFLDAFSKSDNKDVSSGIPKLVYCNNLSMAKVTQILLPGMLERKKGLIINISSILGVLLMPGGAIYSASKKFVNTFTKALDHEYKCKGIVIQNIQPGPVRTNMTGGIDKTSNLIFPGYEKYAEHALNTVGKMHATAGYRYHDMLDALLSIIPENLFARVCLLYSKKSQ